MNNNFLTTKLTFIAFILFCGSASAQDSTTAMKKVTDYQYSCGSGAVLKAALGLSGTKGNNFSKKMADYENSLVYKQSGPPPSPASAPYVIPVVFHVVSSGPGNVSYAQLQWQINALNAAFANSYPTYNGHGTGTYANNTQISFCLATIPEGTGWTSTLEPGVMRYVTTDPNVINHVNDMGGMTLLANITHSGAEFPFANYLNIWVVDNICDQSTPGCINTPTIIGYGTFPGMGMPIDGIVMRRDCIGDNTLPNNFWIMFPSLDEGKILAHEVGHYLGLFHTFETCVANVLTGNPAGCYGTSTADCLSDGDLICDTPPTSVDNNLCGSTVSTCTDNLPPTYTGDANDMLENFMCYSDDQCLNTFTGDQTLRMYGALDIAFGAGPRQNLVSATNLTNTGVLGPNGCANQVLTALFNMSSATACVNSPISFVTPTGPALSATTWLWDFGDMTSSTIPNPVHTYTAAGTYTVSLAASDGTTTLTYSTTVSIGALAQIVNQSGVNVCSGNEQSVYVQFAGTPPFSATITDGTTTYTLNTSSTWAVLTVPVTSNVTFSLTSVTDALGCASTFNGTASFIVYDCCGNLVFNGDFEQGNTGFASDNLNECNSQCWGYFCVDNFNSTVGNWNNWIIAPHGLSLGIDGQGNGGSCTPVAPITPNGTNTGATVDVWKQNLILYPSTNYQVSFLTTEGNIPWAVPVGRDLRLRFEIRDITTSTTYTFGPFEPVFTNPSSWMKHTFNWNSPSTLSNNIEVAILQVDNFNDGEFDYLLDDITIQAQNTLTVSAGPGATICPSGSVTLTGSATGTPAYSYSWTPTSSLTNANTSTPVASPSITTGYTMTVEDAQLCVATSTVTVSVTSFTLDITSVGNATVICSPGSLVLTANADATSPSYQWYDGSGIISGATSASYTATLAGNYYCIVTDGNGCSQTSATFVLNPDNGPVISTSVSPNPICSGQSSTLTASGAASYTWSVNAGSVTTSTANVTPVSSDTYTVTGANSNGCTSIATVSVMVNPVPVLTVTPVNSSVCQGQSIILTASGASTYAWSANAGSATTNTVSVTPATNQVYTVTGTDASGFCSSSETVAVNVFPVSSLTFSPANPQVCVGQTIALSVSGGTTYNWSPVVSCSSPCSSVTASPSSTTSYTVASTDANGCPVSGIVTVTVNPLPVLSVTANSATICAGQTSTLTANGAASYTWSANAGSVNTNTASVSPSVTDTYTVTGEDVIGCTNTATVSVTVNPLPIIVLFAGSPVCSGQCISMGVNNPSGAIYSWSGPAGFTSSLQNVSICGVTSANAGVYTVTVTVNGCSSTSSVNITVTPSPTVTATSNSPVCAGQSIILSSSTTSGTNYNWIGPAGYNVTTSSSSTTISGATTANAGTYSVTVTDGGCVSNTATVSVVVNPVPATPVISSNSPVCSGNTLLLSTIATGVTYNWSGPNSFTSGLQNPAITGVTIVNAGTYSLVVIASGCTSLVATTSVIVNPTPPSPVASSNSPVCVGSPLNLFASFIPGATYSWSGPSYSSALQNPVISGATLSSSGTYSVTVTANGCVSAVATTPVLVQNCNCTATATLSPVLSGTTLPSNSYAINTNITINGMVNWVGSEFKIAPYKTITINPGGHLVIRTCHLYSCNDMWQGIIVLNGGQLEVISNSLVEDAIEAVNITSYTANITPVLNIENSTFNKNVTSVNINNYPSILSLTYPFSIKGSVFTSRVLPFTSTSWPNVSVLKTAASVPALQTPYLNAYAVGSLKIPFFGQKPQMGIYLSGVGVTQNPTATPTYYETVIGTGSGSNFYNIFDYHSYGIYAVASNFTCINNVFQNSVNTSPNDGIGINCFVKGTANVRANVIPGTSVGGFNNRFFECTRAIKANNYFEVIARYCDVRSLQSTPGGNHPGEYGFYVTTNRFRKIDMSLNKLYNIENAISFYASYGSVNVGPFSGTNGQYSGQVDVNYNTIQPVVSGPTTTEFVSNAITVSNIIATGTLSVVPGTVVNVNSNNLTDVYRGIYCSDWQGKNVRTQGQGLSSLPITLKNDNVVMNPFQYGINHSNNHAASAWGNTIFSNHVKGPGIGINPTFYGIYTSMCGNQYLRCNTTEFTYKGISFDSYELPTANYANSMSNHNYGFVLENSGQIGTQGSSTFPMDDKWPGTWPTNALPYKTAVLNATSIGSTMIIRNNPPNTFMNPEQSGYSSTGSGEYSLANTTIQTISGNPPQFLCPAYHGSSHGGAVINGAVQVPPYNQADLEAVALGNFATPIYPTESKYIAFSQLYRALRNDNNLMAGSGILQTFYNKSQSSSLELFCKVEDLISAADLKTARTTVNSLNAQIGVEDNYKAFYNLYLNYLSIDTILDTIFAPADSASLYKMAQGCPFSDGAVIYQARALYNAINSTNIIFNDNCKGLKSLRQEGPAFESGFDVNLYPNPTTGHVFIAPLNLSEGELKIKVIDMNGKTILESVHKLSGGITDISMEEARNGFYFVQVINTRTGEMLVKKLAIQK